MVRVSEAPRAERPRRGARLLAWAGLLLLALAALAVVLIPAWVIQPFKPQTARGLELSYALRSWSPTATVVIASAALALVAWLWRGARRWWRKAALVLALLPVFACVWLARQNHFEWAFRPMAGVSHARADEAAFVADTDMVMAVELNGDAVAYPIRQLAYHHLVADVVGGVPLVGTY